MNHNRTNSRQTKILIVFGILLLLNASASLADIKLPAIISNNMVLQQDTIVPIWGWAEPGEEVMVNVSWHSMKWAVTANENGKWKFKMKSPQAGGPYEMTISGKNTIKLENIMVGDVWVCSGQSNMEWPVARTNNAEQEIASADYPNIRLFTVVKKVADKPQSDCRGRWTQCSPQTVPAFSAVAYYFGRELHKELDMPIGLIHTSWGGTPSEAWTRREILEKEADAAPILERFDEAIAKYPQAKQEYDLKMNEWREAFQKAKAEGTSLPERPRAPFGPGHSHSPAGLYNAMLAPLIPYGIKGAIWYQGETNAGRAYQYRKIFPAMIKNWRNDWGQGAFPFLFVQLANYKAVDPEPVESYWAELREAQLMTLDLPNTGMAVIIDIGEADDIHPRNKQDVGKRLALWALAKSHGKELVYSGPTYKSMTIKNEKVILDFDHVGGGLTARANEALKGFAIAGADRKFVWADAKIEGNQIIVSSDKVTSPAAVRYAWADNPVCNLSNKEGLPASPFRTDDWPGVSINNK